MKLFQISATRNDSTGEEEFLFVLADSEDSAIRIAREDLSGKGDRFRVVQTAEAAEGLPPRVVARSAARP